MEENPYQAPESQDSIAPAKRPRKPVTLVELLVIVAIIIVLTSLLLPAVQFKHPQQHKRPPASPSPTTTAPIPGH